MPKTLVIEQENGVMTLWLNRPEAKNAFNPLMVEEMQHALSGLSQNREIRVVIIRGTKNHFCSGADINWMKESGNLSSTENEKESLLISQLLSSIKNIPQPTIAIAEGGVFGGAVGMLAVCDWVIAIESCSFGFPEVHLGIIPAVIWPHVLNRIPPHKALQKALTGKKFTSQEAVDLNLVDQLVDQGDLKSQLDLIIKDLKKPSPDAQREIKSLSSFLQQNSSEAVINKTITLLSRLKESENGQEGLNAFLEKRKPEWK